MFGSSVLDVAAGLIYVLLMVSLVCTAISSKITEWLNWRADFLEKNIRELLMNGDQSLVDMLYNTPWVKSLAPSGTKPTSIPTKTFALAVFDAFVPNAAGVTTVDQFRGCINMMAPGTPLKKEMLAWVSMVGDDMNAVRINIENWFNAAEKTMTDVYSRNLWMVNLIIGLIVSLLFNVDTIAIGNSLWRDSALRQSVVTAANKYIDQSISTTTSDQQKARASAEKAAQELNKLNLPIGWDLNSMMPNDWLFSTQAMFASSNPSTLPENDPIAWILKLVGWFITAIAGAQGAPFWFDTLRKITQRG
jgi:hypothetical protein